MGSINPQTRRTGGADIVGGGVGEGQENAAVDKSGCGEGSAGGYAGLAWLACSGLRRLI